nr:putative pan domain-containing protein [Megavirus caiporensis]
MSKIEIVLIILGIIILIVLIILGIYFYIRSRESHITPVPSTPIIPSTPFTPITPPTPPPPTPTPPTPTSCSKYSILQNKNIPVTPLPESGTQSTEADCQKLCDNTPNCNFYGYETALKYCALSEGNPSTSIITGFSNKNIGAGSNCPPWGKINVDIPGFSTSTLTNKTNEECQKECETNNCDWYNYDSSNKNCVLNRANSFSGLNTGFKNR